MEVEHDELDLAADIHVFRKLRILDEFEHLDKGCGEQVLFRPAFPDKIDEQHFVVV